MKFHITECSRVYDEIKDECSSESFGHKEYFKDVFEDMSFGDLIMNLYPDREFEIVETNAKNCVWVFVYNKYRDICTEMKIWKFVGA